MGVRVVLLTSALVLASGVAWADSEQEPNDSAAQAQALTREIRGGPAFLRSGKALILEGSLAPGDVDFYQLGAREGDLLTLSILESGEGEFEDPVLAVFGPGNVEDAVARNDDGGLGFLPSLSVEVTETGTWTLAVTGFGDEELKGEHDFDFVYRIVVGAVPQGHHPHWGRFVPFARQGRQERAAAIVSASLTPGDIDRFAVLVNEGTSLAASLYDGEGGEFNDATLVVRDLRGVVQAEDDDSGPNLLPALQVTASEPRFSIWLVEVGGFDWQPEDEVSHSEQFRYHLLLSRAGFSLNR